MKLKRLFTAVLSTALALSLCAMPAMAADDTPATPGTTPTTTPADGTPVWDATQKGSITIHKFEYNPASGTKDKLGTGAAGETAPDGATPLGGVTFAIYKVQNEAWLKAYYGGQAATDSQDFSKINAGNYYSTDKATGAIKVNDGAEFVDTVTTATTETNKGVAQKDNLDFGLYLVVETSAPDKVTAPADPFLVSVPMTRIANSTDTNALTDWIYDVHVYPKNATTYGKVTIKKNGYTGGTLDGALKGVQFILQKKTGSSPEDWTKITKNDRDDTFYDLKTNASGEITLAGLSQGEYRIYEEAYSDTSANKGYILDEECHYFTVEKDGKIKVGENAAIPNAAIEVANHRPDMEKKVKKDGSWEHDAQYGVGDTVPYQITIDVPKNIAQLSTFTVTDTPTGLTDDENSIAVKKADASGEPTGSDLTTIYTKAVNSNGFTITFTPSGMAAYAGEKLVITYNATVNNNAVVGGSGNLNKATLTYTNKIKSDSKPDTTTYTIEDSAVMYSFGIKVVKTAGDTSNALPNVVFDLYREAKAGETAVDPETVKKAGLKDGKNWFLVKRGLTTDAQGIINTSDPDSANYIGGLAYGDYYLVETKTAKDYNLLTKPVEVKLHVTANVQWKENKTFDESGKLTKRTVETTTFTNANADSTNQALVVAKVINRKGFTLPVTGGFGTLLFSGIGVLLVLAGVGVLFSLKKKPNRA